MNRRIFASTKTSLRPLHFALLVAVAAFLGMTTSSSVQANDGENWTNWRGPFHTGVAPESDYPTTWNQTENVEWKLPLESAGGSTPAVWGDTIFLTATKGEENTVMAVNFKGEVLWTKTVGEARGGKHRKGTACNPSPVTDGKYVFGYYKSGDLACVDFDGEVVWSKNLQRQYGEDTLWWDLGTSPVLSKDFIIVAVIQSDESYIVAFEKATGEQAWKAERNLNAPEEANQTYSTPQVVEFNGEEIIVALGADHVTANSVKDGKEIWRVGGLNPGQNAYFRSIASPVVADGIVLAPYARGGSVTAIKLGGTGNVTSSNILWSDSGENRSGKGSDVPTPIVHNGKAFICNDHGHITCRDLKTGKVEWEGDLERSRTTFSSSPILAGDHLYMTREDGVTFVIEANEGLKEVGRGELGEYTVATPVFVNNKILIRTFDHLYCISK